MWKWLLGRKRSTRPREQDRLESARPNRSSSGTDAPKTLAAIVKDMESKGYQGPFCYLWDEIVMVMFHGPGVSLEPPWIEPVNNLFQMRVLDCKAFCLHSLIFREDTKDLADARFQQVSNKSDNDCRRQTILESLKIPCLLSYPRSGERIPDGAHFVAESMEDLWNIFLFDDHFHFVRSWTGQLRYRAKVLFRDRAMFITEVEASQIGLTAQLGSESKDERFPVRQVDFLIKALLYRINAPAPLPHGLPDEPRRIAPYSFMEYGRWGWFPTFEDTTEYRLALNWVAGKFVVPPQENTDLLPALQTVEASDNPDTRQKLLEALERCALYFAFSNEEETLTPETRIGFLQHDWHGEPCLFAYTDPAFRIEPSQGCFAIGAAELWSFIGSVNEHAGLVINPAGPATCKLQQADLKALARGT